MDRITTANIREVIAKGEAVRISDVASRLYTTNKQAVRKLIIRWYVEDSYLARNSNISVMLIYVCIEKYNLIRSLLRCPRSKPKSEFKNL